MILLLITAAVFSLGWLPLGPANAAKADEVLALSGAFALWAAVRAYRFLKNESDFRLLPRIVAAVTIVLAGMAMEIGGLIAIVMLFQQMRK